MFHKKYMKENKVIDLSLLPPCKDTLVRHIRRANTISSIWKKSINSNIEIPDLSTCGWTTSGDIDWLGESFPENILVILINNSNKEIDEIFGSNKETDLEDL